MSAPVLPPPGVDPVLDALSMELFVLDSGLGLFRLVHLVDALRRVPKAASIVSVGSGLGLHEAFVGRLFPEATVTGVDLRKPHDKFPLPNVRFVTGDVLDPKVRAQVPPADFVFSLECLEHVEDDHAFFSAMASFVAPGGHLYVEVPFASDREQEDREFWKRERELHEHMRPGYSARQLSALVEREGLGILSLGSAFWYPVQPLVWLAFERLEHDRFIPHWPVFYRLVESDLRDGVAPHRGDALGIKVLARRR